MMPSVMFLVGFAATADAARPDQGGGLFHFEDSDVLAFVDGPTGAVRVHYSVDGPNVTRMDDDDEDGIPDFPQLVADTAENVLAFYESEEFRTPLRESDMGLSALGGSDAFDFYLVDFGGNSDGNFSVDACAGDVCSGFMIMENDFRGYGYPSLEEATAVLTSHELFHAVQAAYNFSQPGWMSEGTAVWAERRYDPSIRDFLWFAGAYLEEPTRSLNRPPAGMVTAFSYGTALFFEFMSVRLGTWSGVALQEAMEGRDEDEAIEAIDDVFDQGGLSILGEWPVFAAWNLATGDRAGGAESYEFAADIGSVPLEVEAGSALLMDDNRFYPLAATYFQVTLPEGEAAFAAVDDPSGLVFSLHPVSDGDDDGVVDEAVASWEPSGAGIVELGSLPAGGYLLVGSYPEDAEQSVKIEFCLGEAEAAAACLGDDGPDDTGDGDDGGDDGASQDTGEEGKGGCGCAASGAGPQGTGGWLIMGMMLAAVARRRNIGAQRA
jgi:MYXO-CTERM domain-containing protein